MKIPVRELRYNPELKKDTLFDTDIVANLRQETIAVLAIVTQSETNVVVEKPVKTMEIASFEHYTMYGQFSSGDATGEIRYFWNVRKDNPEFFDVHKVQIRFTNQGWCDVDYSVDRMLMDRISQEYQLFVKANRNVPKKFEEIENKLMKLRSIPVSQKARAEIIKITDEISAILGNISPKASIEKIPTQEF